MQRIRHNSESQLLGREVSQKQSNLTLKHLDRKIHSSNGRNQRVAIARTLHKAEIHMDRKVLSKHVDKKDLWSDKTTINFLALA